MSTAACANCNARPGTEIWSEGTMAYVHGAYQMWCKICVVSAQLQHARERAEQIPVLECELIKLKGELK